MLVVDSLADRAERQLKEEIISARLAPGKRIDVKAYASAWNVSPTPIRDAVKQLERQGLAEISPRHGVFVARLDSKALKDIFDLRIVLECLAVELATPLVPKDEARRVLRLYCHARDATVREERNATLRQIDNLIHDVAMRHCDNPRLIRTLTGLCDAIRWSQNTVIRRLREPYEATLPEHIRIAEAMCARDVAGAVRAMREHLRNTFGRIRCHLEDKTSRSRAADQAHTQEEAE